MSTRRSTTEKAIMEDADAPPVLEREIKEELIDSDELEDSDVSQNLMSQLMKQLDGSGSDEGVDDAEDPFPMDFGVKNLAPRTSTTQAKLFGAPPPLHTTISRNSRGPLKGPQPVSAHVPDRRYTLGPAKPKPPRANQRIDVVGTNTKPGPQHILAERQKELRSHPYRKVSPLEAYNGGRPGEKFKPMSESEISGFFDRLASTSSAKKTPAVSVQKMLQEQPSVRMEVKVGTGAVETVLEKVAAPKGMPKKLTLRLARTPKKAEVQLKCPKEEVKTRSATPEMKAEQPKDLPAQIRRVADQLEKEPSTQDVLMSSMVMNALTNLKARDNGEHAKFSAEIFGLMVKYGIQ